MQYLLIATIVIQLGYFFGLYRSQALAKKREKFNEMALANINQWVVTNDRAVMQNLEGINELMQTLYVRIRAIDLQLRNNVSGDKQSPGLELQELQTILGREHWTNAIITESTHKDAIEKIRSEDLHYYYATLIEELQALNRQIGKNGTRGDALIGTGIPGGKMENSAPVSGWYNRVNKIV